MDPHDAVVAQYVDFAAHARDESACFEEWALGVVDDEPVRQWIESLPGIKRQPNLVFAAARWHGVPAPGPYAGLRAALLGDDGSIRATVLERATQTNEVGRLATLAPVLATIPGPLALVEAGASAGLCLYPDRYDYAWPPLGGLSGSGGPLLTCAVDTAVPLPTAPLDVAWRGGVDLHPLDVVDDDAMAWLENLVWPEQEDRRARLRSAVEVARTDPPRLVAGDLLDQVPALVDAASAHGTVVVFHSAVIAYLDHPARAVFASLMLDLVSSGRCHWVSNEAPSVLPGVVADGAAPDQRFALALDGRQVAWAHGHGSSLTWL